MADVEVQRDPEDAPEGDYTTGELIYWIVGIMMIPLVPIAMIYFLTPWSGM